MTFTELGIKPALLKALAREAYTEPTPIQEQAIPPALAGRDLLGVAQTGTGKTAAFAVPILQNLGNADVATRGRGPRSPIRALILTPTRELALQIYESLLAYGRYCGLRCAVIYGGVSQKPQEQALTSGIDILVATPGRLKDLINQGLVDLSRIEILTLDEADRMLDMGFILDVRFIIARTPARKQTFFFSATMPQEIVALSRSLLDNPVRISVTPDSPTVDKIAQTVYTVNKQNKRHLLLHLLQDPAITSALIFTRTKHGADRVVRDLVRDGVQAQAIHGNKSQNARQLALNNFKKKATRVLVATDIAARGIDIDELSHVINYDLPEIPESYIHRIGRTGRAGLGGTAISFCDRDEMKSLRDIERLCGKLIPKVADHPFPLVYNPDDLAVQDKQDKSDGQTRSAAFQQPQRQTRQRSGSRPQQRQPVRQAAQRAAESAERPSEQARREPARRQTQAAAPADRSGPIERQPSGYNSSRRTWR
jgi:ATP-dependent RNA helicase RhlE